MTSPLAGWEATLVLFQVSHLHGLRFVLMEEMLRYSG